MKTYNTIRVHVGENAVGVFTDFNDPEYLQKAKAFAASNDVRFIERETWGEAKHAMLSREIVESL